MGADNFYLGVSDSRLALQRAMVDILSAGPAPSASLREAAASDAVFVLGEDVWNTAPILALNLRQAAINVPAAAAMKQKRINRWEDAALREAIQDRRGPFFVASVEATELDSAAAESFRASPADIARLGFAVAHEIDDSGPNAEGLSEETRTLAQRIARALMLAEKPLIVSGSGLGSPEVVHAAANLARALKTHRARMPGLSLVFPEANSFGATLLARGGIESALKAVRASRGTTLVVAETDLFREVDAAAARELLEGAGHVIAIDHTANATTEKAEVILPAATYAESSGTMVSMEGRAQRFFAVFPPTQPAREAWAWLGELSAAAGRRERPWEDLDSVISAIAAELPTLARIRDAAPKSDFRMVGQRIPRKTHRETGRTSVTAHIELHEPKPPSDADSPLAFTMEGRLTQPPSSLIPRFWAPGWNSDQALNKFQIEVGGPLRGGDPGVRIVEPPQNASAGYFPAPSPPPRQAQGIFILVPRHHVFGSDELSVLSRGVAQRAPRPYIALCSADARALGLAEGQNARVTVVNGSSAKDAAVELPVVIRELPQGIASVPWGVPGMPLRVLPAAARVTGGGA